MKETIQEKINNISLLLLTFVLISILFIVSFFLYFKNLINILYFRAFIFIYALSTSLLFLRFFFLKKVKNFADLLGFKIITPFYLQPKIEGFYNNNWWQIHYVSKETGKNPSILRTYIKLQYKDMKNFDKAKLEKYDDIKYKDYDILTIKHIVRPYKNYLLMKVKGFLFDKNRVYDLMNFLLNVAKETEIKKSRNKKSKK